MVAHHPEPALGNGDLAERAGLDGGVLEDVGLVEPYVFNDNNEAFCAAGTGAEACPPGAEGVLVPEGRLWVMGDHRGASSDSRAHRSDPGNGTIPIDKVVGRAFVIVWPVTRLDVLEVPKTFDGGP